MRNPKFEQKIKDTLITPALQQDQKSKYGIIVNFNKKTNSAMVQLINPMSHMLAEVVTDVPCGYQSGIQMEAPTPGRLCMLSYLDSAGAHPVITQLFSAAYSTFDYETHYYADSGVPLYMRMM